MAGSRAREAIAWKLEAEALRKQIGANGTSLGLRQTEVVEKSSRKESFEAFANQYENGYCVES